MSKIAIVTGATRYKGIGKAICTRLARQGFDIFFTCWPEYDKTMPWGVKDDEPQMIRKEIVGLGVKCEYLEIDLMHEGSAEVLFGQVEKILGKATVLVNNATYSTMTELTSISAEELDRHYQVNVRSVILLTAAFVKRNEGNSGGRIINMTSGQSLSAMNVEIAYAVTKGAIETFTRTMQHELALKGITINAVNPGLTDSGWVNSGMSPEQLEVFRKRFPAGRLGLPDDAARLVAFLASEEAQWITGQIIHSEGGFIRENYDC